jgi:hypothetical protein
MSFLATLARETQVATAEFPDLGLQDVPVTLSLVKLVISQLQRMGYTELPDQLERAEELGLLALSDQAWVVTPSAYTTDGGITMKLVAMSSIVSAVVQRWTRDAPSATERARKLLETFLNLMLESLKLKVRVFRLFRPLLRDGAARKSLKRTRPQPDCSKTSDLTKAVRCFAEILPDISSVSFSTPSSGAVPWYASCVTVTSEKSTTGSLYKTGLADYVKDLHPAAAERVKASVASGQLFVPDSFQRQCKCVSAVVYLKHPGTAARYLSPVFTSLITMEKHLPGWIYRLYMDMSTLDVIASSDSPDLRALLAMVVTHPRCEIHLLSCDVPASGATRTLRYAALMDPEVAICALRDADGIVSRQDCANLLKFEDSVAHTLLYDLQGDTKQFLMSVPVREDGGQDAARFTFPVWVRAACWQNVYKILRMQMFGDLRFLDQGEPHSLNAGLITTKLKFTPAAFKAAWDQASFTLAEATNSESYGGKGSIRAKFLLRECTVDRTMLDECMLIELFWSVLSTTFPRQCGSVDCDPYWWPEAGTLVAPTYPSDASPYVWTVEENLPDAYAAAVAGIHEW